MNSLPAGGQPRGCALAEIGLLPAGMKDHVISDQVALVPSIQLLRPVVIAQTRNPLMLRDYRNLLVLKLLMVHVVNVVQVGLLRVKLLQRVQDPASGEGVARPQLFPVGFVSG